MPIRCFLRRAAVAVLLLAPLSPLAAQTFELVMYDRAGCVWCARWESDVGRVYGRAQEGRLAPLRRVDIRDQRRSGVELEEPVVYTPTFVVSHDGVEIGRITGYQGEDLFWGELGALLQEKPRRFR